MNEIKKTLKKEKKNVNKELIKGVVLLAITFVAYFFSVYVNGFLNTNYKLLNLVLFAVVGFLGFFVIYLIIYLISVFAYKLKRSKKASEEINCDEKLSQMMANPEFSFKYQSSLGIKGNLNAFSKKTAFAIKSISTAFGGKGEYAVLDLTVYDALNVIDNAIDGIYGKVDGFFKVFHLQNRPIGILEKSLSKLIEGEKQENENRTNKTFSNLLLSASNIVFKKSYEKLFNDLLSFICAEAFRVYSKNSTKNVSEISFSSESDSVLDETIMEA